MSNNPQTPPPDPGQEPTVLALFKSVTKDWGSFINFICALWDARRRAQVSRVLSEESLHQVKESEVEIQSESLPQTAGFPWRSILALLLALYAQLSLEPPGRNYGLAIPLFIFAAGLVMWADLKGQWRLPAMAAARKTPDPLTTRLVPLFASLILALLAFWDFGEEKFTATNVTLWILSLALLVFGLWLRRDLPAPAIADRHKTWLWSALLLAAFGLVFFFRFNRINTVPAEPFSDHAEKILDIYDITQGKTSIFFTRNTGREGFQMYWTLLVAAVLRTGLSFLSLKLGTALLGFLTLPFIYMFGKELGGRRSGVFALFLFGIAYWPNLISRIGLRFPLYPLFVAPTLFYLMRGLRTHSRNDFILCGLFLGLGLHGYSPFRIVPILVVVALGIYLLHPQSRGNRQQAFWWLVIIIVVSLYVFLPLLRYALAHPDVFAYRALSRLGSVEAPLPAPAWQVFFYNLWRGLLMFNWDDGEIWVVSVPHRPALDVITGALFMIGSLLLIMRYVRNRDWRDIFMLVSIPVLLLPSVLSLSFPGENPALNRAAGAVVPAILVSALALDGLVAGFGFKQNRMVLAWGLTGVLMAACAYQNYDLVFRQFDQIFRAGAWNGRIWLTHWTLRFRNCFCSGRKIWKPRRFSGNSIRTEN
jgi:hypothetical protein